MILAGQSWGTNHRPLRESLKNRWLLHLRPTRESKDSDENDGSQLIEHELQTEDAATAN